MSGVDRIWAWEIDHERTPPNGYYATAEVNDATEYVRRDPAVLAALPEVKALVAEAVAQERERCISRVRDNWVAGAKTTLGEVLAAIRKGATP
jgi:hypothetical protein